MRGVKDKNGKNAAGRPSARERLQYEREKERAREKRKRTLVVAGAVVGVVALAGVVALVAQQSGGDSGDAAGPVVAPAGAVGEQSTLIRVGAQDAPSTLTVWEDFRCPACKAFEDGFRDAVHDLEQSGQLKVEYNFATLIDGNMGGSGSLRAANAAACAEDAGKFREYHDVLFRNQPQETDDAFAKNDRLLELAGDVQGLDTPAFEKCVNDGTYDNWVKKSNGVFQDARLQGTPTVQLNGESVFPMKGQEQISVANLKKWVAEANKGKEPGTVSASPSASGS
ncbi:DsbA family protein [Streptomyces sp. NPDC060194]|uniref:DsbA family protein n=1 Tax=Streptomyces sp. NPDC060194 TaxID=3347069 RepID=UPI00364B5177